MKKIFIWLISSFFINAAVADQIEVPTELKGKTVTMLVPYPPGGDTDAIQRGLAKIITEQTGLNIMVATRPGAGTTIATRELANSKPDGLTIMGIDSAVIYNAALGFPSFVDPALVVPINIHAFTPHFLFVKNASDINSITDLIKVAKEKGTRFTVGCSSAPYVCAYQLKFLNEAADITATGVRFKGVTEMVVSTDQNDLDVFGIGATSAIPHVQSQRIKPVATGWTNKLPVFPDAAPLGSRVKGFKAYNIQMAYAPAGTPKHILEFWNVAFRNAAKSIEFREKADKLSIVVTDLALPAIKDTVDSEYNRALGFKVFIPKD